MDDSDVFSHFGALDELIQIIYQAQSRFVLLSNVADSDWTVHLRLSGPEGRCWRGKWLESDVLKVVGSNGSPQKLESFAQRLAEVIIQGELSVGDWDSKKASGINLILAPTSKRPLIVKLVALTPEEASAHATGVFVSLGLEARERKCRLNPSSLPVLPSRGLSSTPRGPSTPEPSSSRLDSSPELKAAKNEIKSLRAQLVTSAKRKKSPGPDLKSLQEKAPRPKGASLANPNKKARKYQALEFASDDD